MELQNFDHNPFRTSEALHIYLEIPVFAYPACNHVPVACALSSPFSDLGSIWDTSIWDTYLRYKTRILYLVFDTFFRNILYFIVF